MKNRKQRRRNIIAVTVFALFLASLYFILSGGLADMRRGMGPPVILEIDLEGGFPEIAEDSPLHLLRRPPVTLRDLVDSIDHAARDPNVAALIARVGNSPNGLARIQEIRDALLRFRESGKPAIAWSMTFGELEPGNASYYLATAFDEIHLQPSGEVAFTGLRAEIPFAGELVNKLGIEVEGDTREEYKSVFYLYTESELPDFQRDAEQQLLDNIFGQLVRSVAVGRDTDEATVREWVARAPLLAPAAFEHGLVDSLRHRDQVYRELRGRFPVQPEIVGLSTYAKDHLTRPDTGPVVALITGDGAVLRGRSNRNFITGSRVMGADSIVDAFERAIDDSDVRVIVYRITSPGGSVVASEAIWRMVQRAREAGKPVVVSMGDVAASGGYYIAMGADRIVAQPGTVTGSIGVVLSRFLTEDMWSKLGITWDAVQSGPNADWFSSLSSHSPEQWAQFQERLDFYYDVFVERTAEGRGLSLDEARSAAKGRVWSGEQALELGLVDALGGLDIALDLARDLAEVEPDAPVRVVPYPRPRTLIQRLLGRDATGASTVPVELIRILRSLYGLAGQAGLVERPAGYTYDNPERNW